MSRINQVVGLFTSVLTDAAYAVVLAFPVLAYGGGGLFDTRRECGCTGKPIQESPQLQEIGLRRLWKSHSIHGTMAL